MGDLGSWADAGGNTGLAVADAICRARGDAAGLADTVNYKAWLSNSTTDAADRLTSDGPWVRLDGIPVADSKMDLLDGTLFTSIAVQETMEYDTAHRVWTGTSHFRPEGGPDLQRLDG